MYNDIGVSDWKLFSLDYATRFERAKAVGLNYQNVIVAPLVAQWCCIYIKWQFSTRKHIPQVLFEYNVKRGGHDFYAQRQFAHLYIGGDGAAIQFYFVYIVIIW